MNLERSGNQGAFEMFSIGEQIVYPVHGAGVIEAIETREILGEERNYYVLKLSTGDLRVLVPVDGVERAGVRQVSDQKTLDEVDQILRNRPVEWEQNWNRRYRLNMEKIKSGDICALAEVVRNLSLREMAKGLSAGEKKMLDNARKIFISEIILASGVTAEAVGDYLEQALSSQLEV